MQFLLVQNKQQTHDWTLIGWGANGLRIQECIKYRCESDKTLLKCLEGYL